MILIATLLLITAQTAEPLVLDEAACVALAMSGNPQVGAAEETAEAAAARVNQARAARLPQITANGAYTYIDGLPVDLYTGGALSFLAPDVEAEKWSVTGGVALEQVLFAGGRLQAAQAASAYLAKSEAWRTEATRHEVAFAAVRALHDARFTVALVQVAEERAKAYERHLADARDAFEVGMIPQFAVLRAESEWGARAAEQTTAASQARLAGLNLLRTLGLPQDSAYTLAEPEAPAPVAGTLEEHILRALEQRPELRALDSALAAAGQQVRGQQGQYLPQAGAQLRYDDFDGGVSVNPAGWSVNVGVQWELFTSGRRKAEVAEARAEERGLEYQRADVAQLVELDVRQAWLRIEEAAAQAVAEEKNVALAEEGLRMAELRFQEGIGTQGELLDAELALHAARVQLTRAHREQAVSRASLDKAVGNEPLPQVAVE
jgi:outer membrane protein TolC